MHLSCFGGKQSPPFVVFCAWFNDLQAVQVLGCCLACCRVACVRFCIDCTMFVATAHMAHIIVIQTSASLEGDHIVLWIL